MQLVEKEPFYFYHLYPKNIVLGREGLVTPEYWYANKKMKEYLLCVDKYRDRIVNDWKYYGCFPEELTPYMIHEALNKFHNDKNGNNRIYMFRYLPYKALGANMKKVLDGKKAVRIDLNDGLVKKYIAGINWGYYHSFTGNRALHRHYYERVNESDYFRDYDDGAKMIFAKLNHIAVIPLYTSLPKVILEDVEIL